MLVHIIGPNLSDQSKGDFHVHAKGCAEVTSKRAYRGPDFAYDRKVTYNVSSKIEVSATAYADQIGEGSMTAHDGVASIWFAPCTALLPYRIVPSRISYERQQIQRVLDAGPDPEIGEKFLLKVSGKGTVSTHWLSINADQLARIADILDEEAKS